LTSLAGLSAGCPLLETIQVSHNQLATLEACEDLWHLSETLSSVDLSFNKLERAADAAAPPQQQQQLPQASGVAPSPCSQDLSVVHFFEKLPNVSVIYLHGNPLTHGMKNYRKNMIVYLKQLTYLDERPVFPEERRTTEAWGSGGEKAETEERVKIKEEKRAELTSCVETMARAMEASKETRDRLTKQWEEKREVEREELRQRRLEMKKKMQTVDSLEYDSRSGIEIEEEDSWMELAEDLDAMYRDAFAGEAARRKAFLQAEEIEAMRHEIDEQLHEQETRIAEVLEKVGATNSIVEAPQSHHVDPMHLGEDAASSGAPIETTTTTNYNNMSELDRIKARETMEYWIRQLDATDDEVLTEMETDLQQFLRELEPSLPATRVATAEDVADVDSFRVRAAEKSAQHVASSTTTKKTAAALSRSVTQAVALTSASLREGKPSSSLVSSKEAMWESYYAWETRNRK